MEVVGDHLRLDVEHREIELDVGAERAIGELAFEIAEVRREEGFAAADDAEGALQFGAGGEDRGPRFDGEWQGPGREAARAPDRERGTDDRVLAPPVDRSVVAEERVRDAVQARARVAVVEGDRLVRPVAAGHHERGADLGKQKMMERRVGQHHADPGAPRGHRFGDRRPSLRRSKTIGRRARLEQRRFGSPISARSSGFVVMTANGLSSRCFRDLSFATVYSSAAVAGEMPAAEPLDREDRAALEAARPHRLAAERVVARRPGNRWARRGSAGRSDPRTRAGTRGTAGTCHGRVRPVVRDGAHDREPGPAFRAVDERIAVAAIGGIEQLAQAVVAGRDFGRDQSVGPAGACSAAILNCVSPRTGIRSERSHRHAQAAELGLRASANASSAAAGPSASIMTPPPSFRTQPASPASRQPVDERPEADSLDDSSDSDSAALHA